MLSIPHGPDHVAYTILGKQLKSDIFYLEILGLEIVVLNSSQAALDLLEKRSALYSDRVCPPMVKNPNLLDWSGFVGMVGYNDLWRHHRRMINNWLNTRAVSQFSGLQEEESRLFLMRLLDVTAEAHPFERLKQQTLFTMSSVMFQLAYGYRLEGDQDAFFTSSVRAAQHLFESSMYPNFLVNTFPALSRLPDWLPGMQWKRDAQVWRKDKEQALDEPLEWTRKQATSGSFSPSILGSLLQGHELVSNLAQEERDSRLKELGSILLLGSTDTTSAAVLNFVAAMVTNPGVQERAQNEIDGLLGNGVRLPTMRDQSKLPYVRNLISEVLRWRPVAPTGGVPHVCFQDDVYRGYEIKKGTIMIGNLWAMSRDESVYKYPESFNPDRFLDPNVPVLPAFGWGKRKCAGVHFAEASLFIVLSSLLTAYTFSKKKDSEGKDINPIIEDAANALAQELKPFEFEFRPRSERHKQLVLDCVLQCK